MAFARIELKNIRHTWRDGSGESGLSVPAMAFESGRHVLLTGPTGSGKTTLLHLLGGLVRPQSGEILADGVAVSRWTAAHRDRWRQRVGILFQHMELIDGLNADQNVMAPLVPRPGSVRDKIVAVAEALAKVGAETLAHRQVRALSGGERQLVALARAIVGHPDLLLLDEPTSHQDDDHVRLILDRVNEANDRGAIVITASHDPRLTGAVGIDATHVLGGGRVGEP